MSSSCDLLQSGNGVCNANILPFSETFAQSSNVAIIKVAAQLGEERTPPSPLRADSGYALALERADRAFVSERLADVADDEDLSRYIL